MHFLAIEIGGSKLQVCVGDASAQILERQRFNVQRERGSEGIREQIASVLPDLIKRWQPEAVGVGYGGPVDWRTGLVTCSHHVAGWENFPLGDWLHERTELHVVVENDANVAALGEALYGAGRSYSPVFWVNCGSGVGGGLVVDGAIYHGASPGETEIGHIRLDRDGTIVEDRCSGWAVDRAVVTAVKEAPDSVLAQIVNQSMPGCEARHLKEALAKGCEVADRVLTKAMDDLAFALSHVVQLLNPQTIIIGGGLCLLGEPLRERLAKALPRWIMQALRPGPFVQIAALGEDAVPTGALALAARSFHSIAK
jgi:glucokinase